VCGIEVIIFIAHTLAEKFNFLSDFTLSKGFILRAAALLSLAPFNMLSFLGARA
jgi:hypothetical protein